MVIRKRMEEGLDAYNSTDSDNVTDPWDMLQQDFHCCGIDNYTNWGMSTNTGMLAIT